MTIEEVDVVIVGAGLSGIGAAVHLRRHCPDRSFLILEGREAIGGTWDLFRYPGIRSDSDMYTLGYSFKPWTQAKAIADGPSIREYVRETAREHDLERSIRFRHRVRSAAWTSDEARWTLEVQVADQPATVRIRCNFLYMCSGYYRYDTGYTPKFEAAETFRGRVVHPQHWPEDLDYRDRRVVVIGSGATAVTVVPELARQARQVTMLQRSPTYMVSRPSEDALANRLRRYLPQRLAYAATRWKNVLFGMYIFRMCRTRPALVKQRLIGLLRNELPPGYDVATHFTPRYNPWDQRLCLVPDSDFFRAIREQKVEVVTDHVDRFTPDGIQLASGRKLDADIIVTATGLELLFLGGLELNVDGRPIEPSKILNYKGMMYSGVPNLASAFGYTNASWTLKADLTSEYVCRLLNHMRRTGTRKCMPRLDDPSVTPEPWVDFSSGYFQRAQDRFPKQGSRKPWKLYQNYARDLLMLRFGKVADGVMEFSQS